MHFLFASRPAAALAFTAAAAAASFQPAHARQAQDDETLVVTGSSLEETLPRQRARHGSDLAVRTEMQVRESGAVDVATALRAVPSLYVQPASGPFSYVDVSLQGSRTQDVLWTVDGIRINNRLYGSTSPNDTLPASMIERVEVLKGGESLFYGTQAAAGVINVVTRDFADRLGGQVDASVDSFAGTNIGGYLRGGSARHQFVAWGSHNRAQGYRAFSRMEPSATDRTRGYDLWSIGGKYRYDLGPDWRFHLQYIHTEAKLDNLSPTRIRQSRNDRNEEIASARLDYVGSETVQLFLKAYLHDWKTAYVQIRNAIGGGAPIVVYPAGTFWGFRDYGGNVLVQLRPHRGLDYVIGYDFQQFSGRDDVLRIGATKERVHAGSFQIRTNDDLARGARLSAGLRYNDGSGSRQTVWNVTGRVELSDRLFVQANGGTSFLLPSASQLYQIDPCCERGNPNLQPEQSLGVNAGLGGRLADGRFTWQATVFARRIDHLIAIDPDNPAYPDGIYANSRSRVHVRGAELVLGAVLADAWHLDASYTLARARNAGSSLQRDRTPEQLARGTIAWRPRALPVRATASVNWVGDAYATASGFGRRNYGNYALVDAGLQLLPDAAARHRVGIHVENLFDRDYATRGFQSAVSDSGVGRFLYFTRGVPRTLRVSYGLGF